jgi:hypothetical protein
MNKLASMSLIFFLAVLEVSCATSVKVTQQEPKPGAVTMHFQWLKDKGKKFDFNLMIANKTDQDVLLYLHDMRCYRGTTEGKLEHTFFNTGHRTFKYHAGQTDNYNMVCAFPEKTTGEFRITLTKVYKNPGGDGVTQGEEIAHDIAVSLPE